jgi:predicted nucleic acid-binding Zn ribbon protein
MPIWTYECVNSVCKETIEHLVLTTGEKKNCEEYLVDDDGCCIECPKCKQVLKRVMSIPAKGKVK